MEKITLNPDPALQTFRTLHCAFLVALALLIFAFEIWVYTANRNSHFNYIFQESSDLHRHIVSLSTPQSKPAILVLGTSSAAGNFVPPNTTVSDYMNVALGQGASYGLAALQGNIITSISILRETQDVPTRWVTFGICPDVFPLDDFGSPFVSRHMKMLEGVIPPEILKQMNFSRYGKLDTIQSFIGDTGLSIPSSTYIAVRTEFLKLQRLLYGNLFKFDLLAMPHLPATVVTSNRNELVQLLPVLKKLTEERGARLLVYFEPILQPYTVYGKQEFETYQNKVAAILTKNNIRYRDFANALPNTHDYFMDSQHLTPLGNKTLANELLKSIAEEEKRK